MTPELIAYWQRQLRLQDWDIHVDVIPAHLMSGDLGYCSVQGATRRARIKVADPTTLQADPISGATDVEGTLVHELLHVALPGDNADGSASQAQEQGIEAIAQALVRLNRGERR